MNDTNNSITYLFVIKSGMLITVLQSICDYTIDYHIFNTAVVTDNNILSISNNHELR